MPTQPARPRRCTLAVPGSSEKMMAKAAALSVDQVFLDLEDAVAIGVDPHWIGVECVDQPVAIAVFMLCAIVRKRIFTI